MRPMYRLKCNRCTLGVQVLQLALIDLLKDFEEFASYDYTISLYIWTSFSASTSQL